ncbi:hypothetical protein GHK69_34070 [Sinorhizobium meliloti]|uniref:hypothetical protein n=1 Tax=Rhizobium meliloti TaxID=382 RepID=UPI001297BB1B|nr:hypothetical protein [Sinorhizobium meliloti]MQW30265.1 hypothetical protein [Sinorhizobium meliloti]
MSQNTFIARLMIGGGNAHIGFAKIFIPVLSGSVLVRPERANWIAAYAALTIAVAVLGIFMRAAGENVLANH